MRFLVSIFFFTDADFHLALVAVSICHFLTPVTKFSSSSPSILLFYKVVNNIVYLLYHNIKSEPRRKPFQAPLSISQAKNRVEIHHDSLDSRSNTTALGRKLIAKILSLTRR